MIIAPEIVVTPDLPTIRFREPMDHVNLDTELPKILHSQGWGCGTYFHVQFLSHDKSVLLASAQFIVSQVSESIHTSEANPYQPVTKTVFGRKADRIGEWWTCTGLSHLEGKTVKILAGSEETLGHAKGLMMDGNLAEVDIVHPPLIADDKQPEPAPTRRGRPPKTATA